MSDTKKKEVKAAKKEAKPKREARKAIEPTPENLKLVRSVAVVDYPLAAIKATLKCTWKEAVALRHAAMKADKS